MHINKLHHTKNSIDIYNGLELWRRDNFSICILRFFDRPDAEEDLGRSIVHVPCNEGSVVANWEGGPVGATCKHIRFLGRSQGDMGMWSYYKELLSQSHMYRTGWNMLDGGHFLFHGLIAWNYINLTVEVDIINCNRMKPIYTVPYHWWIWESQWGDAAALKIHHDPPNNWGEPPSPKGMPICPKLIAPTTFGLMNRQPRLLGDSDFANLSREVTELRRLAEYSWYN